MNIDEQMIDDLISQMTLDEKVGQLNQHLYGWQCFKKNDNGDYELTDLFKQHVQRFGGVGAIYGLMRADAWSGMNEINGIKKEDSQKVVQMIQDYLRDNTRLKIPALITEECVHGQLGLGRVVYPTNLAIGMTWNPSLLEAICDDVSFELGSQGGHLALFSALDVMRDPRWGRSEECFSEDTYLTCEFVKSAVNGFQKNNHENGVAVVLKHLCAQGACSGGHNSGAAAIGPRELQEIFLPPVQTGVKSGAKAVMAAYNEIDGIPCHINKELLTDTLRGEYGFEGIVMADGCALDRLLLMDDNRVKMAGLALEAGVDLSLWDDVYTELKSTVEQGYIDEAVLDQSVMRILKLKMKLGLFIKKEPVSRIQASRDLALQAARECQVLLKNDDILPIKNNNLKIAVIGPNANNKINQLGDYTPFQKDEDVITLYEGLKQLAVNCEVNYALGCKIRGLSKEYIDEAVNLAKESDIVVLALGGSSARNFKMEFESNGAVRTSYDKYEMNCGENVDMASLDLDGLQIELFHQIKAVNDNIITVLIQGRPHSIIDIAVDSKAVLCGWYPGNLGGIALAETILGINNPSGKLSVSIPRSVGQLPCYYNGKSFGAKVDYVDLPGDPLYPFGYGLSYSEYQYQNICLSEEKITIKQLEKQGLTVNLDVINTGTVDGQEVVQLYLIDNESTVTRRQKELKGFVKVAVKAGQKRRVSIHLDGEAFKIWNYQMKYLIEPGSVDILIAKDSQNYITKKLIIMENNN